MTNEPTKISQLGQYALAVFAAIAMLPGCSGSQMQIPSGATQSVAPSAQRDGAMGVHPDHGRSWMKPEAKRDNLLYISDIDTFDVYVYAYPKGELLGTLTGFNGPEGECVDKTGNVFVANYAASNILEFAHGGTSSIATLKRPRLLPGRLLGRSDNRKSCGHKLHDYGQRPRQRCSLQTCHGRSARLLRRSGH